MSHRSVLRLVVALCQPPNKQLQRTVKRHRGDVASAPFHYALASRCTRERAAAELRRYASSAAHRFFPIAELSARGVEFRGG
jgi:predicted N-formylglutamate amidohydrolase